MPAYDYKCDDIKCGYKLTEWRLEDDEFEPKTCPVCENGFLRRVEREKK